MRLRTPLLHVCRGWLAIAAGGCFTDAPSFGASGPDPDASGDAESTASAATTPDTSSGSGGDGLDTGSGSASADGASSGDASDDTTTGVAGCAPDCPPGAALWTVLRGSDAGRDSADALAIADNAEILVAGAEATSPSAAGPWLARYDLDGNEVWSTHGPGNGASGFRGLSIDADDQIVAAGANEGANVLGILETHQGDGAPLWGEDPDALSEMRLLGVAGDDDGGFFTAGCFMTGGVPQPALLHHANAGAGSWILDRSSVVENDFSDSEGGFFSIVKTGNGRMVAVGYAMRDGSSDGAAALLQPDGSAIGKLALFACGGTDDFIDVAIDDGGLAHVAGRCGQAGGASDLWLAELSIFDTIDVEWEVTYPASTFTVANALAQDGATSFVTGSTNDGPDGSGDFDTFVLRWDGHADAPTWFVPFADEAPGLDYGSDVALAADDTIVAAGVVTPVGAETAEAWIRRLAR